LLSPKLTITFGSTSAIDLPKSVVVLITQRGTRCVQNIPNSDGGTHVLYVDCRVQSKGITATVLAIDVVQAGTVLVLPDAEVPVDEGVVQEEDGVGRGSVGVLHHRSDPVVSPGVCATFGAARHVRVVPFVVAAIDQRGRTVLSRTVVVVASKTMKVVIRARAHIDSQIGKLLGIMSAVHKERTIGILTPFVIQFPPASAELVNLCPHAFRTLLLTDASVPLVGKNG
jgi:hypothetical protein